MAALKMHMKRAFFPESRPNLIIVNTSPGAAQLIARVLDYHKDKIQIIGTIAGDDSIFIAPALIKMINDSLREIKNLLFR